MTSDPAPSRLSRYARRVAIVATLLVTAFAALFVSFDPAVGSRPRPTSRNVAAALEVWQQLAATDGTTGPRQVRVDNEALVGIAALASDASGLGRFEAGIAHGVLSGRASIGLPLGLWVNVTAIVVGEHAGFPAYALEIGRVRFPLAAGRWAADLARLGLRLKGVRVPPLDAMIRRVDVGPKQVVADLVLPADRGMVDGLISASGAPLDQPLVSTIYCRIAAAQQEAPVATLGQLVRRTFDPANAREDADYNRAAFVALSLLVVGEQAEPLAPEAVQLGRSCAHPASVYLLQQRDDLAKHWAFSAGLTAVLGGETARSIGEWKELDDSLPHGEGFSFVDLAADRSGLQTAHRALDPERAETARAELARATDEDLLPRVLLQAPEGLTERSFVDRFGALDRAKYRRATASIDRVLAQQRSSRSGG